MAARTVADYASKSIYIAIFVLLWPGRSPHRHPQLNFVPVLLRGAIRSSHIVMGGSQNRRGADEVNLCSPRANLVKIGSNY